MTLEALAAGGLPIVADALDIGIAIVDSGKRVTLWNAWLARYSGRPAAQALGLSLDDALPGIEGSRLGDAIGYALEKGLPSVLSLALQKTPVLPLYRLPEDRVPERRMPHLLHVIPLEFNGERACLLQVSDMTAAVLRERLLRQQAEALRRAQNQDALTGVAKRAFFDAALEREFQHARRDGYSLALCLIDFDFFRDYNAKGGERSGDACLVELGRLLRDLLPAPECLAARYGGDEFALLLPGIGEAAAAALAEEVRSRFRAWQASPTLSIGLCAFTPESSSGSDMHTLQAGADIALYHAKQEGRDRAILFSPVDASFRDCAEVIKAD